MTPVITESPRDAMQGLFDYIPVQLKADYINSLLNVGFDIIDFGSFVSAKAIPQLKDTAQVLQKLNISASKTKLMVLIANSKGAETAMNFDEISWLAFPFSVSPTFLKLNINADAGKSLQIMEETHNLCLKNNKKLKVYLTMAFGNPYGDVSNPDVVLKWVEILAKMGVSYISLSDITGESTTEVIASTYSLIINDFTGIEFGFHLHTTKDAWYDKLDAAYKNGCRSFDAVINGLGGCPMTGYDLVSNLNTIDLISYFNHNHISTTIDNFAFEKAVLKNYELFKN